AEVPATLHRQGEVGAVGGAGVGAQHRAQRHLALDVEVDARVADLAVDPGARGAAPAGIAADGDFGLVPVAAALAPVVALHAVAEEATVGEAVAAPGHADG